MLCLAACARPEGSRGKEREWIMKGEQASSSHMRHCVVVGSYFLLDNYYGYCISV